MNETTNITEDWRDEDLAIWEIAVLATILVITLVGNSLILFAIYIRRYRCRRKKLTRMHFFIMHLSIADLLTALLNVLPQLAWDITFRFNGGPLLCKLVKFCQPFGSYLSSYVLIVTAVDRYHAICHPLSYCKSTFKTSRIIIYCVWILSFVFCIPQVFVFSYQEVAPGIWDCWAQFTLSYGERLYVTWYSITAGLLPFAVLAFTYTEICCAIWKQRVTLGPQKYENPDIISTDNKKRKSVVSKAKMNTVKQTLAVVTLYALSSSPFIVCQLWATWDSQSASSSFFTSVSFTILSLLSSLTSCVNPWIYLTFSYELRLVLTKTFRKMMNRQRTPSLECASSNGNSNETRSSGKSTLVSIMSRYFVNHRTTIRDRNIK